MSRMQNSYLTDLLQKASEYRGRQLEMERKQALTGMQTRTEPIKTNITPSRKPLVEPNTRNKIIKGTEVTNLFEQAKQYNPFATTKTEAQLKEPLTYFDTLSKSISTRYLEQTNPLVAEREKLIKERAAALDKLNKENQPTLIGGNRNTRRQAQSQNAWEVSNLSRTYEQKLQPIEQQLSRLSSINTNVYGSQTKTLSDLSAELKKYYGSNFENLTKEQLAIADLKGFQSLTGDIAKYTSLRDSYIKKYQQTGSKIDMDWINQYNDLLNSTAKSISQELPKIFNSAGKAVTSIKESQQSTLSALEALNRVSGVQRPERKNIQTEMDVAPIGREQAIARQRVVSQYSEQSKPAPKFTARPI